MVLGEYVHHITYVGIEDIIGTDASKSVLIELGYAMNQYLPRPMATPTADEFHKSFPDSDRELTNNFRFSTALVAGGMAAGRLSLRADFRRRSDRIQLNIHVDDDNQNVPVETMNAVHRTIDSYFSAKGLKLYADRQNRDTWEFLDPSTGAVIDHQPVE